MTAALAAFHSTSVLCCGGLLIGLWLLASDITLLSVGRDVAVGLGQRSSQVRIVATLLVLLLTGAAGSAAAILTTKRWYNRRWA